MLQGVIQYLHKGNLLYYKKGKFKKKRRFIYKRTIVNILFLFLYIFLLTCYKPLILSWHKALFYLSHKSITYNCLIILPFFNLSGYSPLKSILLKKPGDS
jgi:hypothetical protein